MELREGMELKLVKDLDCGIKVVKSGELFNILTLRDDKVTIRNSRIGIGVFDRAEIEVYFEEYINEPKLNTDVQRVIYSDKVTVVILTDGCKGIAKCLEEDTYNKEAGYKVAYLKAKIKSMTKELKKY